MALKVINKSFLEQTLRDFKNDVLNELFAKNTDVSPVYKGKNVVHMGDSWIDNYGLAEGVATKIGYTVRNCGVQATAISDFNGSENAKKCSLINVAKAIQSNDWTSLGSLADTSRLNALKNKDWSTVDVLILSYGVNDYGYQNPVGDVSARDEESVCGALKTSLSIFQNINPNMEIIVTTPCYRHHSPDSNTITALTERNSLEDYRNAIALVTREYGIKLVDMNALSGINASNYATTLRSDGLHPTELGKQMWIDAFCDAMVSGYCGALDVANDFSFETDNLCFDSEKLLKHKQWNASFTKNGVKYLCTSGIQQYRDCILGMTHFDSLPVGTKISLNGYGMKIGDDNHRIGFYIKNSDKSQNLLEKYTGLQLQTTDGAITFSFTTTESYTDVWVIFYAKIMTAWDNGKALVRDMKCTVRVPINGADVYSDVPETDIDFTDWDERGDI